MITKEGLEREFYEKFGGNGVSVSPSVLAFFSSKYQELLKEVIGNEVDIPMGEKQKYTPLEMGQIGFNQHVKESKSRASLRGFKIE